MLGELLGLADGDPLGDPLGLDDGLPDGEALGDELGLALGEPLGAELAQGPQDDQEASKAAGALHLSIPFWQI